MGWQRAAIYAALILGGFSLWADAPEKCADKGAKSALETCTLGPPPTISGRCELVIGGEKPVSCMRIQLLLRSRASKKHEERAAVIDGFSFKFTDLTQNSYDLIAASPEFTLSPLNQVLTPGQTGLKIHIDAKPRK